ncbi:MAG: serine hydrolase [Candidatus Hydrogenedentota bacterium]|nr:MAG: serine hydrolase [Candidatus Hydrogenedentota bacterium]
MVKKFVPTTIISLVMVLLGSQQSRAQDLYFPPSEGIWETISHEKAGFDKQRFQAVLDFAQANHSSGLVVLYKGRILAEKAWTIEKGSPHSSRRYERMAKGRTADGQSIEDVASVQKSVVSFLAGIAVGQGKLDITKPVSTYLGEGWSKAPLAKEKAITVHHLMSMTSGLNDALDYKTTPGSKWRYNTGSYSRVVLVLESIFGQSISHITQKFISQPIGMRDSQWVLRPWAAKIDIANKSGFTTTPRDLARFGLMIQAGGKWGDQDILQSPGYLKKSLTSSQKMNPAYGLLWWLNSGKEFRPPTGTRRSGSMVSTAPSDLVGAMGALGRKVYVVPSLGLVVTRLGNEPEKNFDSELWKRIMTARN